MLGGGELTLFHGIRVYQNGNCLENTWFPVRPHIKKEWMTEAYHKRIQKKWIKRWGYVMKPVAYQTPMGLVCHPAIYEQLTREFGIH